MKIVSMLVLAALWLGMSSNGLPTDEEKNCPDLKVSKVDRLEWNAEKNRTEVQITVHNIGDKASSPVKALLVDLIETKNTIDMGTKLRQIKKIKYDGPSSKIAQVYGIAPGKSAEVTFFVNGFNLVHDGKYDVDIRVDVLEVLGECDEDNNMVHYAN